MLFFSITFRSTVCLKVKKTVSLLLVLFLFSCDSEGVPPEPKTIGKVVAYNCSQSFSVSDDGTEIPRFEVGKMLGLTLTSFDDGRPSFIATCDAYESDSLPCPMDSDKGNNVVLSGVSYSESHKITYYEADDGSKFELKEAFNEEHADEIIIPRSLDSMFSRVGYTCVGKKTFSLGQVDTADGKLLLIKPL